jgi:hypothetical protein
MAYVHDRFAGQVMTRMQHMKRCWRPLRAAALSVVCLGLSIGASAAQDAPGSREHVYLMRGAFNVFSLGMDEIAAKLQRLGINATVENYLAWDRIVNEAAAEYQSGRVRNIILVGHSSGATAVTAVAAQLGARGVPVKLAVGLDPTTRVFAAGRVERYINYYAPGGMGTVVDKGRDFTGVLQNVSTAGDPGVGHFNIDKNQALQNKVVAEIRAAARAPARATTARGTTTPAAGRAVPGPVVGAVAVPLPPQ